MLHVYRLTLDLCGELPGLIRSLAKSLRPVPLIGLLQSGKKYVSSNCVLFVRSSEIVKVMDWTFDGYTWI